VIEGAAILAVGWVVGHITARLHRRNPKASPPICGCTHHFSMHDTEGCHHFTMRDSYDPNGGKYLGKQPVRCGCRKYVFKDDSFAGMLEP
jgi:hypothetical protein